MNSRERVLAVFAGDRPDRVPLHHLGFSSDIASALLGREAYVGGGIQQWREATALWQGPVAHQEFLARSFQDAVDVALLCEHDIIRPNYWRHAVKPTRRLDAHTFLYEYGPEEAWSVLRYDPGSEQCHIYPYRAHAALALEDLDGVVARQEEQAAAYQPTEEQFATELRAQALLGDRYIVRVSAVSVGIPTDAAWLEATLLRPDLVERLLDTQVVRAERNIAFLAQRGFPLLFGGGDLASNEGPMYAPRLFCRFVAPRVQHISTLCHRHGVLHLFASDGDLWPVADALLGDVDGYLEIDRRAGMALAQLRRRFPALTLIGNISSHTVAEGTVDEVLAEARSCLADAKACGRIIVGTSNYFVPGTPIANVRALLDVLHRER